MAFDFLKVHSEQGVGWIEYNRPPRNAFTFKMNGEVTAAVEAHVADQAVHVIVIASALDDYFSVGAEVQIHQAAFAQEIGPLDYDVTDESGQFMFRLAPGSYDVTISSLYGQAERRGVKVERDRSTSVEIHLDTRR